MVKQEKLTNVELNLNEPYNKILAWFFSYPDKEISLSELAEKLKISKTTANVLARQLEKEDFLKIEEIGRTWRIKCNKSHSYNYTKKVSYNLALIYESEIIKKIQESIKNYKAIILFGSYRKGDDIGNSDIDIAIETANNEQLKIISLGIIQKFGYRQNVPVNLHIFSRNKININLFANIANGIVIEGFLEAKP